MEDNSDVTHRPDPPLRAMNVRLPSARKLSIVLLAIFVLFAALASTSSFTTITPFPTSATKLANFALKLLPSSGKAPIQISNVTFNYLASAEDDDKTTMDCTAWVHSVILAVAWSPISMFIIFALGFMSSLMLMRLCEGVEKMKTLVRVAYLVSIDALGYRSDHLWVGKEISTTVTTFGGEHPNEVHTTVTVTVTTVELVG